MNKPQKKNNNNKSFSPIKNTVPEEIKASMNFGIKIPKDLSYSLAVF